MYLSYEKRKNWKKPKPLAFMKDSTEGGLRIEGDEPIVWFRIQSAQIFSVCAQSVELHPEAPLRPQACLWSWQVERQPEQYIVARTGIEAPSGAKQEFSGRRVKICSLAQRKVSNDVNGWKVFQRCLETSSQNTNKKNSDIFAWLRDSRAAILQIACRLGLAATGFRHCCWWSKAAGQVFEVTEFHQGITGTQCFDSHISPMM